VKQFPIVAQSSTENRRIRRKASHTGIPSPKNLSEPLHFPDSLPKEREGQPSNRGSQFLCRTARPRCRFRRPSRLVATAKERGLSRWSMDHGECWQKFLGQGVRGTSRFIRLSPLRPGQGAAQPGAPDAVVGCAIASRAQSARNGAIANCALLRNCNCLLGIPLQLRTLRAITAQLNPCLLRTKTRTHFGTKTRP
jgi:hypothetical protein